MKKLENHTIIYDEECPLCQGYTQLFIKTGMLDSRGRVPFNQQSRHKFQTVDWNRARNEIAVINTSNNNVTYGIDSLLMIIGNNFPILKRIHSFKLIRWFMQHLYYFISFNRKVISPGKSMFLPLACVPDQNRFYRAMYIMATWLITSLVLTYYVRLLPYVPTTNIYREFLICGGQLVFQGIIVYWSRRDRFWDYLGNLMTVSAIGAILLIPMLLLNSWVGLSFTNLIYFVAVVGFMFYEHKRRVGLLHLHVTLTWTWVIYRLGVLAIII